VPRLRFPLISAKTELKQEFIYIVQQARIRSEVPVSTMGGNSDDDKGKVVIEEMQQNSDKATIDIV
jgi:hypothetical protein